MQAAWQTAAEFLAQHSQKIFRSQVSCKTVQTSTIASGVCGPLIAQLNYHETVEGQQCALQWTTV